MSQFPPPTGSATPNSAQTATLESMTPMEKLPVELLDRILRLSNQPHNVRLACRLVCRGFCSVLNPEAFRRIRTSEFNRDAFDRLLCLSQSPLAQFVVDYEYQLIPFFSASMCWYSPHPPDDPLSPTFVRISWLYVAEDIHDVDPLVQLTSGSNFSSVQEMAKALLQHHKSHLHQVDVLGTFYDIISLSKALPAFRNLKSVTVSCFGNSQQASLDFELATTRAFWAVIKALNNCPFQIESFTIDSFYYTTLIGIPTANLKQIHRVFEGLIQFSVPKLSSTTEMSDRQVQSVLEDEIISKTPNVEILRIGNEQSWRADPYQLPLHLERNNSLKVFYWPYLRVLEMNSRATVCQSSLVTFLGRHRRTLRELTLKGFALAAGSQHIPDWRVVFGELRALLQLEKLVLSDLRIEERRDREGGFSEVEKAQLSEWEKWVLKSRWYWKLLLLEIRLNNLDRVRSGRLFI